MGEPGIDDVVTADSLTMALRTAFQPEVAASVPPADYELHVGDVVLRVEVDGDRLTMTQLSPAGTPVGAKRPAGDPELVFAAGPGIRRLISGELTPGEAIDQEVLAVVAGDATLLQRFAATFHIDAARPLTSDDLAASASHYVRSKESDSDTSTDTDVAGRGRIFIDIFTTLDGVAQAPGGPEEDTSGGFPFGGWQAPFRDERIGSEIMAGISSLDALLLGRRTYDIFAAYWPNYGEGEDNPIAEKFNAVPKYVASRGTPTLEWEGTTLLGPDVLAAVDALRDTHREIHVIGSIDFAHTLIDAQLFDELVLWVYPIVLGQGKKVFPDGVAPGALRLSAPAVTGDSGAVSLRYAPAGKPTTGDMTLPGRGV